MLDEIWLCSNFLSNIVQHFHLHDQKYTLISCLVLKSNIVGWHWICVNTPASSTIQHWSNTDQHQLTVLDNVWPTCLICMNGLQVWYFRWHFLENLNLFSVKFVHLTNIYILLYSFSAILQMNHPLLKLLYLRLLHLGNQLFLEDQILISFVLLLFGLSFFITLLTSTSLTQNIMSRITVQEGFLAFLFSSQWMFGTFQCSFS